MEMEDHHQYGMGDLRQFLNGRTSPGLFTAISQPTAELISSTDGHRHQLASHAQAQAQHYEMLISTPHQLTNDQITTMPPVRGGLLHHHHHHHHHQLFRSDSSATGTSTAPNNNTLSSGSGSGCLDMDQNSGFGFNGGGNGTDGGTGRWPRQETLTLLEIRSRLDSKFKEANQKGPLWDEVSRIMCEEHGHQRSGKKCREKFENLYKYYKKTKDGKAGRQDGKHYRFFRQLEALYGESSSNQEPTHLVGVGSTTFPPYTTQQPPNQEVFPQAPRNNICDDSFTPSNSSAFDTSSSDDCSDLNAVALKRRGKRSWKAKIRDFIDGKMRRLMEKQEAWLEKMMKSIEHKEQERVLREEEWRKQEAERFDREHKFWAKERAWIEARDAGLMEALHKLTGIKELKVGASSPQTDQDQLLIRADNGCETITNSSDSWAECEVTKLIQLRTSMESMFVQQSGINSGEEVLWEEIASNMACLGYENRSGKMCKEKWDSISNYIMKPKEECSKKRKENDNSMSRSCFYFQNNESISNNQGGGGAYREGNELGSLLTQSELHVNALSNSNPGGSTMQGSSSFRFFMGDQSDNSWENYGLKLSKGDNN